jgi:hypothetical protein
VTIVVNLWRKKIEDSNHIIFNLDSHTRRPLNGSSNPPDVSLISSHLALSVSWSTEVTLNSDHLPIGVTFTDDQPPPRTAKTFVNFKRAKWGLFTSETEKSFTGLLPPSSCSAGEKTFRKILSKASKHIPAGFRKDFQLGIPREAIDLTVERDRRRALDPQDPELPRLNQ